MRNRYCAAHGFSEAYMSLLSPFGGWVKICFAVHFVRKRHLVTRSHEGKVLFGDSNGKVFGLLLARGDSLWFHLSLVRLVKPLVGA